MLCVCVGGGSGESSYLLHIPVVTGSSPSGILFPGIQLLSVSLCVAHPVPGPAAKAAELRNTNTEAEALGSRTDGGTDLAE